MVLKSFEGTASCAVLLVTMSTTVQAFTSTSWARGMNAFVDKEQCRSRTGIWNQRTGPSFKRRKEQSVPFMLFESEEFVADEELFESLVSQSFDPEHPHFLGQTYQQMNGPWEDLNSRPNGIQEIPHSSVGPIVEDFTQSGKSFSTNENTTMDPFLVKPSNRPSVPVLGPFLMQSPLMVGDSFALRDPTPMQWKTLEEAVILHDGQDSILDTAPVVAIIDEFTSKDSLGVPGMAKRKGRYATLAAVMGMTKDNQECEIGDELEEETCTVRLLAIGRAVITDYYNRIPSSPNSFAEDDIEDSPEEEQDDDLSSTSYLSKHTPILMGEFVLYNDGVVSMGSQGKDQDLGTSLRHASASNTNFHSSMQGKDSFLAGGMSPMALLAKLGQASNKINWLHSGRQTLVNKIKGIAPVSDARFSEPGRDQTMDGKLVMKNGKFVPNLENFGLSSFGALSPLVCLTDEIKSQLAPYYSEQYRQREEWDYEVQSFVAMKLMKELASPSDIIRAVTSTSPLERLEIAHEIMLEHHTALQTLLEQLQSEDNAGFD